MVSFGLNQIASPDLNAREFCALASAINCRGIELRTDVGRRVLDTENRSVIRDLIEEFDLEIYALSEVGSFDNRELDKVSEATELARVAIEIGANAISFIPRNDNVHTDEVSRKKNLRLALKDMQPIVSENGIVGLVEPLGFDTASLRQKSEIVDAIVELGFEKDFKIIHDTFHHTLAHHTLAMGDEFYSDYTGLVHISGVEVQSLNFDEMRDEDRVLVGPQDRLGNVEQIKALRDLGYAGPVSFEPFSPAVQNAIDLKAQLEGSMRFIDSRVYKCAA